MAAVQAALPVPSVPVHAVVPYGRGDLVSRVFEEGELTQLEHRETGTELWARVSADLAAELEPYDSASAG